MPSQSPWPFMPVKSTEMLLMHADPQVYTGTPDTILYKLVDAICGTTGAGALVNEIFLARAAGALETIYFNDLDYIFGKVNFLARSPAESYPYDPNVDELTADQWNEVRVKDAWYRARVKDFFLACGLGTTLDGIRMAVQAALAVDADVFEVWRYVDNFGITEDLGRAPGGDARNELIVKPHKTSLAPAEMRLLRDMLDRMTTLDTVITVNPQGLAVLTPVPITAAAADSTYYEVQKVVTPSPLMAQLPSAAQLPIDLGATQQWMFSPTPVQAPYPAFGMSQEYSYFYLTGGGKRSPIDSVTYGTINSQNPTKIAVYELSGTFTLVSNIPASVPPVPWFSDLSADVFQWIPVKYQADLYPMDVSITQGVASLISAINGRGGPFIIAGYDQGAIIASNVYDEIRTGSLAARRGDFLGAVVFGNARRQAGHTFPRCPDPGGSGVAGGGGGGIPVGNLLESEDLWYEFAVPGDLVPCNPDDSLGLWNTTIFNATLENYTGLLTDLTSLLIGIPEAIISSLVNSFYMLNTNPGQVPSHQLYPVYQPLKASGDVRTCVEIASDYMTTLANTPELKVTPPNYPFTVYGVEGTQNAIDVTIGDITIDIGSEIVTTPAPTGLTTTPNWFDEALALPTAAIPPLLDPRIRFVDVNYPAYAYPMNDSVEAGVNNLITLINRNPGKFALMGFSQGATIVAMVYKELQSGSLQHRWDDLVAGVTFGNLNREAGHTFPGCIEPGGHGCMADRLMTDVPDYWWDFADPMDPACTVGDDLTGQWMTTVLNWLFEDYTGDPAMFVGLFADAPVNIPAIVTAIFDILFGALVGHATYFITEPLAHLGDHRTTFQIAADYLNTFASLSTPYVAPPFDPMSTYRSEANFESFVETAQFGSWQTYAIADSPDNYPGGKFGVTPSSAPALNPDGTPYNFPYASQTAYVMSQITQVQAMGGQADNFHFRMPVTAASTTKEVYLPEYAIAYTAPMMDSTVSTAVTARRNKTVNQSGSNETFARNGTAPAGG